MKEHSVRNSALALTGLVSLVIYTLACTSFSPDDKKVLYPSFDPKSGDLAITVYDRASGATELVFVPRFYKGTGQAGSEPRILRSQWLPDGKAIVAAWPGSEVGHEDGLNLAVVPVGGKGPTRLFFLPDVSESAGSLAAPLAVAGSRLFLAAESNVIVRLDLASGEIATHQATAKMNFYPDPAGERVFVLSEVAGAANRCRLGQLDPDTFAEKPLTEFTAAGMGELGFLAFSRDGGQIAFTQETNGTTRLVLLQGGKPREMPELSGRGERLAFGNAVFSPKGDTLFASYQCEAKGETNATFGFLEVPVNGGAVRRTPLLRLAQSFDRESVLFFQIGLSHDGKTLAVASTYLAVEEGKSKSKPDDCALFLVDLTDAQRKVTRVPIPMPRKPGNKP